MVRVKPSPSRSAPKTSTENWNGTLFILNNSPHFDLEDEPTAPSPTETPSPTPTTLSSSSDKRYLPWDQRRGGTAHPLHGHQGLEPFNDMQVLIIDAIAEVGEPATFDQILQLVSSRWRGIKIRRRDGTPYTTDCRRAIQANLRTNPHQVSLFIRVEQPDGGVAWRFSRCIEEAEEAKIKSKTEKSKEAKSGDSSLPHGRAGKTSEEAHSRSDEESAPPSPEPLETGRSMRPIRSTRVPSVFEDAIYDSEEESQAPPNAETTRSRPSLHAPHMQQHRRPNRQESVSPIGSSEDELSTSRRQGVRREYDDESDLPLAKRSHAPSQADSSSGLIPSPSSTPSAYAWGSSSTSSNATAFDVSSAMMAMMQPSSGQIPNEALFPHAGGWLPHVYAYPFASPSPSSYPPTGVPTFLPQQMSLAHEHAQKLASSSSELVSPAATYGNWTDRSSQSRHSFSSGSSLSASTSTLADPSPRMPLSQRASHSTLLNSAPHSLPPPSSHPHPSSMGVMMSARASMTETSFGDASSH